MRPLRLLRLFRTLSYLRPRQIVYQIGYRFFFRLDRPGKDWAVAIESQDLNDNRLKANLLAGQIAPITKIKVGEFQFLNQTKDFGSIAAIDWNYADYGKLWTYNLNYFEFLRQSKIDADLGQALIKDWMDKSATHKDGWEPYPLSLRLVHWLQFYNSHHLPIPQDVRHSLFSQYRSLWNKIEYHIGANHLLENAIALSLTAWFFKDEKRLNKALHLLCLELEKQYLPSGAHYELSPMYHCVLLWRLLDYYAIIFRGSTSEASYSSLIEFEPVFTNQLKRQLVWLSSLVDSKGQYPHFNDSTAGIAPEVDELLTYAKSLGFYIENKPALAHPLPYRKYHWGAAVVWIDVAPIGAGEQAGHAHADNLNFCLSDQDGSAIIVDTGISTYEKNSRRLLERGTAAHNTVVAFDENSSEIWGGFRCGRRARTTIVEEAKNKIVARHDGYRQSNKIHQRTYCWETTQINIYDEIKGAATAYLHFHPDLEPVQSSQQEVIVGEYRITTENSTSVSLTRYDYAAGFNHLISAWRLVIDFQNELKISIRKG